MHQKDGTTTLPKEIGDQTALCGAIMQLGDAGLTLLTMLAIQPLTGQQEWERLPENGRTGEQQ